MVNLQDYSLGEIQQAEKLIFRGKEFAARGDRRLMPLIQELKRRGIRTAEEIAGKRIPGFGEVRSTTKPQKQIEGKITPIPAKEPAPRKQIEGKITPIPRREPGQIQEQLRREIEQREEQEGVSITPGEKKVKDFPGLRTVSSPIVLPSRLKGKTGRQPAFFVGEETSPKALAEAIDVTGKFVSATPVSQKDVTGYGITSGQFIFNRANILRSQEQLKQTKKISQQFKKSPEKFRGTPGFKETKKGFELDVGKQLGAKQDFFDDDKYYKQAEKEYYQIGRKPIGKTGFTYSPDVLKGNIGEVSLSFQKFGRDVGRGLASFPLQLSTRIGKKDEEGKIKFKDPSESFKTSFDKELETIPKRKGLTQPATTIPILGTGILLLGGARASFKGAGSTKEGFAKYVEGFQPLRMQRTFTPNIKREFLGSGRFKTIEVQSGKLVTQKSIGKAGFKGLPKTYALNKQASLLSNQKSVGLSKTDLFVPTTKYTPTLRGGEFKTTYTRVPVRQLFISRPQEKLTEVLTLRKDGSFDYSQAKGIRKDVPIGKGRNLFKYAGGEPLKKVIRFNPKEYYFLDSFEPTIKGTGISFKLTPRGDGTQIISGGKGATQFKPSGTKNILSQQTGSQIISGISQAPKITTTRPTQLNILPPPTKTKRSQTASLVPKLEPLQFITPVQKIEAPKVIQKPKQAQTMIPRSAISPKQTQTPIQVPEQIPIQIPIQKPGQEFRLRTPTKTKTPLTKTKLNIPTQKTPTSIIFPNIRTPFTPGIGFPPLPFLKPLFKPGKRKRTKRTKPLSRYQPSFTGSIFKIKGKPGKFLNLGYNPFQIRGIEKVRIINIMGSSKKKKKKKKKKLIPQLI